MEVASTRPRRYAPRDMDWTDIALFAAVARHASLAKAADETGVSVPTLSRRMKALEARTGRKLFHHGRRGYDPTAEGRALLARAARMEEAASGIESWVARSGGPARVRITCGTWIALDLAAHLGEWCPPDAPFAPEIVTTHAFLDIARREADIAIRNRAPDQPWLAGRRLGATRNAVYAASPGVEGWIGSSEEALHLPSERWLARTHPGAIRATANDPSLRLAMAEAGGGRVVLPVWVGDARPGLVRLSDPIPELDTEDWLVCHHESRNEPPIRAALDALTARLAGPGRNGMASHGNGEAT